MSVGFRISEEEFLGHCFGVWAPPRLGAHFWMQFLLALLSTGPGSPCVLLVPPQQYGGALGFPNIAALWSVHGSMAPVSGTGTFQ